MLRSLFAFFCLLIAVFLIRKFTMIFLSILFKIFEIFGGPIMYSEKNLSFLENELLTNKEFIEEFKQLIEKQGGLNEFIKNTTDPDWSDDDDNSVWWHGYKEYTAEPYMNKNAINITNSILNFNSFLRLSNDYHLKTKDITYVGNLIFINIVSDFKTFSEKYIFVD